MSSEICVNCNKQFLTEADDYVITPIEGYALRCINCYFKRIASLNEKMRELLIEINEDLKTMDYSSIGQGSDFHKRIQKVIGR